MVDKRARGKAEMSLPALLRAARGVVAAGIREGLSEAGYDDIPGSGLFVIGAVARTGAQMGEIIDHLGVSKQAAGQLIDTMVVRGYLDRTVDDTDRRRLRIALSERGRAAAKVMRTTVDGIEADLERRVGSESMAQTRATLSALIESGRERQHSTTGESE
jgi:DNA-binding MarR family transcriptional regulator